MNKNLKAKLTNLIHTYILCEMNKSDASKQDFSSTVKLSALQFNSLDLVELLLHLEDELGMDMPDIKFNPNMSLKILVDILDSKITH